MASCSLTGKVFAAMLVVAVLLMAVLIVAPSRRQEGFELKPMNIFETTGPLLTDYETKENQELTDLGSQNIYHNYPVFPADSCLNNNIEYWRRPTNGKCAPADFCDSLYADTLQRVPGEPCRPPLYGVVRVNYYASHE